MIYVTAAVFYALMALVVWDDTSKENRDRPPWLGGPAPSPALRGIFWFPIMLVAVCHLAVELFHEASGAMRARR